METKRRTRSLPLLGVLAFVACGTGALGEEGAESADATDSQGGATLSFQNGVSPSSSYAGTTDTSLQQNAPTTADGSNVSVRVDFDYPSASRKSVDALLHFDLSAIPPGSTVSSVTLTLNVTDRTSGTGYWLYALSRSWTEAQATFDSAATGSAWASGGARGASDRDSIALANLTPTVTGKTTVALNAAGVAAVQKWLKDPATNFGFVIDTPDNADGLLFDSSEAATATNRPKLTVAYSAPPPPSNGTGLLGQYYAGANFEQLALTRKDATVNFNWTGSPGTGVPEDGFSVRWTGQVLPLYSQTYRFYTVSDDGVRVWVNGQKLIDNWTDHGSTEDSGTIGLTAGQKYDLKVEYYEKTGGARAQLSWESASQPKQVIPATQLLPAQDPALGLVHPGILVSKAELDFVKARLGEGAEPWTWQINRAKASKYGKLTYTAVPFETIQCGNSGSTVDIGCTQSREDALAAYTQALIWYYTGDQRYATNAIAILNGWSAKLKTILYVGTDNNTWNGPLQAAWLSELFPRSAEILRYSNSGWAEEDAKRFGAMLTNAILPRIVDDWYGGGSNWNTSMANGVMNIGIYNDDLATFNKGLAFFRKHVPETLYLESDGAQPIAPPAYSNPDGTWKAGLLTEKWHGQTEFGTDRVSGITMETCRDSSHTQMALASIVYGAETARIQGTDLYTEQEARITTSLEFVAKMLNDYKSGPGSQVDVPTLSWLCGGKINIQDIPTWEVAYHHYAKRRGLPMPQTATVIARERLHLTTPAKMMVDGVLKNVYQTPYTNLQISWETLTHGVLDADLH